jgi:hypothetical protein
MRATYTLVVLTVEKGDYRRRLLRRRRLRRAALGHAAAIGAGWFFLFASFVIFGGLLLDHAEPSSPLADFVWWEGWPAIFLLFPPTLAGLVLAGVAEAWLFSRVDDGSVNASIAYCFLLGVEASALVAIRSWAFGIEGLLSVTLAVLVIVDTWLALAAWAAARD